MIGAVTAATSSGSGGMNARNGRFGGFGISSAGNSCGQRAQRLAVNGAPLCLWPNARQSQGVCGTDAVTPLYQR